MDPKLIAFLALLIGGIARASKADVKWFATVPPNARPALVVLLGALAAGLDMIARGTPWKDALLSGLLASVGALLGHYLGVEVVLGGKEVTVEDLRKAMAKDGSER